MLQFKEIKVTEEGIMGKGIWILTLKCQNGYLFLFFDNKSKINLESHHIPSYTVSGPSFFDNVPLEFHQKDEQTAKTRQIP